MPLNKKDLLKSLPASAKPKTKISTAFSADRQLTLYNQNEQSGLRDGLVEWSLFRESGYNDEYEGYVNQFHLYNSATDEHHFINPKKETLYIVPIMESSAEVKNEKYPRPGRRYPTPIGSDQGRSFCESNNGVVPQARFIGQKIHDPRFKVEHTIGTTVEFGTDPNGNPTYRSTGQVPDEVEFSDGTTLPDICKTCPLSSWLGNRPPVCIGNSLWIVWSPQIAEITGGNGLAYLSGRNLTQQAALTGMQANNKFAIMTPEGKRGTKHIMSYVRNNKSVTHILPADEVTPAIRPFVWLAADSVQEDKDGSPVFEESDNPVTITEDMEIPDSATVVLIDIPASPVFPNGSVQNMSPNLADEEFTVVPIVLDVGKTEGWETNPGGVKLMYVSDLADKPLEKEEALQFAQALFAFASDFNGTTRQHHYSGLRPDVVQDTKNKIAQTFGGNVRVLPDLPALEAGEEDDVVNAEFDDDLI